MRQVPAEMADKVMLAAELLAERGLDGTRTEDIAAVTGIPKATLYYYFEGKEQVLSFIFGVVLDAVGEAVASAVMAPGDPPERIRLLIRAHLQVFAQYPRASQALHFDLGRAARLPDVIGRTDRAFIDPVTEVVAEGVERGFFRKALNPRLTAVSIMGTITTTAMHVIARNVDESLEGVTEVITSFVLGGILKPQVVA